MAAEQIAASDLALIHAAERAVGEAQACLRFAQGHIFQTYGIALGDAFDSQTGLIHRAEPEGVNRGE